MADKVSFTDFGTKKKIRKVKRKRSSKPQSDSSNLLDEVSESKELIDETLAPASNFSFPFIEFTVLQSKPFIHNTWNEIVINLSNTGNGVARNTTISFDRLKTRGQTIIDTLEKGDDENLIIEVLVNTQDKEITRMDIFYHSVEGDTFSAVRRDWR